MMGAQARTAASAAAAVIVVWILFRQLFQSLQLKERATIPTDRLTSSRFKSPPAVLEKPRGNLSKDKAQFLGLDLTLVSPEAASTRSSVVHCVGDNFLPKTSAGYRSCQFRHLCWDLDGRDFVVVESPLHKRAAQLLNQMGSKYVKSSSDFNTSVATSATTEDRLRQGEDGKWFPRKIPMGDQQKGFYELPKDVVLVPVEFPMDGEMAAKDILLDLFLPIYNLLAMFDMQDKRLLLVNLSPSCKTQDASNNCYNEVRRFLPLMNRHFSLKHSFMTLNDNIDLPLGGKSPNSNFICAKYGAAGLGALTDHGIHKKSHGERRKDYTFVQNNGRGPLLFAFRNYILDNLGINQELNHQPNNNQLSLRIAALISESKWSGPQDFRQQIEAIRGAFPTVRFSLETYNMSSISLEQQVEIATKCSIFITSMGNGALPALFLPRGAMLIIYFNDKMEFIVDNKLETNIPVKSDWDVWNNLGYIRVHWLPLGIKDEARGLHILRELIQYEIQEIKMTSDIKNAAKQGQQSADGTFNGMKVHFVNNSDSFSRSHCIGDNFQEEAHVFRSCVLQHMCIDLSKQNRSYSLVASSDNAHHATMAAKFSSSLSTNMNLAVALGQNIRFHDGKGWFPEVSTTPHDGYYELMNDVVLVPFHAEQPNIHNPGHLLWDYFLPIYNLLAIFNLTENQILVSNVDDACTQDEDSPCWKIATKFLPLLGVNPDTFRNTRTSELIVVGAQRSNVVCAKSSVAGIGFLTDHGWNRHGQRIEDYRDVHNVGRGPTFFAFRNHVIRRIGIVEGHNPQRQHTIVFSRLSSKNPARCRAFEKQIASTRSAFSVDGVIVEGHVLSELSMEEQVKLATETTVFVSVVGGSACVGTFLPRGSTIILFFNDADGDFVDHAKSKDFPAMIDWDFWNNASYLRVHWLPMSTMEDEMSLEALTELIRSDLSTYGEVGSKKVGSKRTIK